MIKRFGEYILESRSRACLWAFLFALLPLLGWLSVVIIGLVTLRKDEREGLIVAVCGALPYVIFAIVFKAPWHFVLDIIYGVVFIWLSACVLRKTASWSYTLQLSTAFVVLGVLVLHMVMPDIGAWWLQSINGYFQQHLKVMQSSGFAAQEQQEMTTAIKLLQESNWLKTLASMMSGYIAAFLLLGNLINLGLARWWQAMLFNPGGLRKEILAMRPGYVDFFIFVIVVGLALMHIAVALDLIPVIAMVFLASGIMLIHSSVQKIKTAWLWLVLMYIAIILVPTICLPILILLGLIDVFINFRSRFGLLTH